MHKAIERVEKYREATISKAIEKAEEEYSEAIDWYNDTGYDRYYKKVTRLEHEIDELNDYIKKSQRIEDYERKIAEKDKEIDEIIDKVAKKFFWLEKAMPDCTEIRLFRDFVEELQERR